MRIILVLIAAALIFGFAGEYLLMLAMSIVALVLLIGEIIDPMQVECDCYVCREQTSEAEHGGV